MFSILKTLKYPSTISKIKIGKTSLKFQLRSLSAKYPKIMATSGNAGIKYQSDFSVEKFKKDTYVIDTNKKGITKLILSLEICLYVNKQKKMGRPNQAPISRRINLK